jgi:hypothetical protein
MLALETVSQLPQRLKVLCLRLLGHFQARGFDLLVKVIRRQGTQFVEVEYAETSKIFLHKFELRRPIFGENVGWRGHLVQSWMMLASGGINACPLYPHLKAMSS